MKSMLTLYNTHSFCVCLGREGTNSTFTLSDTLRQKRLTKLKASLNLNLAELQETMSVRVQGNQTAMMLFGVQRRKKDLAPNHAVQKQRNT